MRLQSISMAGLFLSMLFLSSGCALSSAALRNNSNLRQTYTTSTGVYVGPGSYVYQQQLQLDKAINRYNLSTVK